MKDAIQANQPIKYQYTHMQICRDIDASSGHEKALNICNVKNTHHFEPFIFLSALALYKNFSRNKTL